MRKITMILAFMVLSISTTAHATLFNRGTDSLGNRLIYDDDLKITWYDYTKSFDIWQNHMNWAAALDVDFDGTHFTDWRLPTIIFQNDNRGYDGTTGFGYNITTGSEMGHLYHSELRNIGVYTTNGQYVGDYNWGLHNTGPFVNLKADDYFSSTEYVLYPGDVGYFAFDGGNQGRTSKYDPNYAMAVRDGDVAATTVPEPSTLLLLGAGLVSIIPLRRIIRPH